MLVEPGFFRTELLTRLEQPPLRFAAGADAVETVETRAQQLLAKAQVHCELSSALAFDPA